MEFSQKREIDTRCVRNRLPPSVSQPNSYEGVPSPFAVKPSLWRMADLFVAEPLVAGQPVPQQKISGRHRTFSGRLKSIDSNGPIPRRDDQLIQMLRWKYAPWLASSTLDVDWIYIEDEQSLWRLPGKMQKRVWFWPWLHGPNVALNYLRGLRPADRPLLLFQSGSGCHPARILGKLGRVPTLKSANHLQCQLRGQLGQSTFQLACRLFGTNRGGDGAQHRTRIKFRSDSKDAHSGQFVTMEDGIDNGRRSPVSRQK